MHESVDFNAVRKQKNKNKKNDMLFALHICWREEDFLFFIFFSNLHTHTELLVELPEKSTKGDRGTVTKNYPGTGKNSNTGEI